MSINAITTKLCLLIAIVINSPCCKAFEIFTFGEDTYSGEAAEPEGFTVDIEHGVPKPIIDTVGWVIGIPNKILLWDSRADNHDVSQETVEDAVDFLVQNQVEGVKVRVNQYDPLGEWGRLIHNERVGLGWRATVGSVYTLGYSVLPGRLFGRDWYNPYTDSVHVYSDIPSLAMEQAAQAKDVHERTHPGFYSAMRLVPLAGIVHEARSKQSVFNHVDEHGTLEERMEARRVLHPQLGTEVAGQALIFAPQGEAIIQLTGAAVGHLVGNYQANRISAYDDLLNKSPETSTVNFVDTQTEKLFPAPAVKDDSESKDYNQQQTSLPTSIGPMGHTLVSLPSDVDGADLINFDEFSLIQ